MVRNPNCDTNGAKTQETSKRVYETSETVAVILTTNISTRSNTCPSVILRHRPIEELIVCFKTFWLCLGLVTGKTLKLYIQVFWIHLRPFLRDQGSCTVSGLSRSMSRLMKCIFDCLCCCSVTHFTPSTVLLQGSLHYHLKQCTINDKSFKFIMHLHCLIPSKMGNLITSIHVLRPSPTTLTLALPPTVVSKASAASGPAGHCRLPNVSSPHPSKAPAIWWPNPSDKQTGVKLYKLDCIICIGFQCQNWLRFIMIPGPFRLKLLLIQEFSVNVRRLQVQFISPKSFFLALMFEDGDGCASRLILQASNSAHTRLLRLLRNFAVYLWSRSWRPSTEIYVYKERHRQ